MNHTEENIDTKLEALYDYFDSHKGRIVWVSHRDASGVTDVKNNKGRAVINARLIEVNKSAKRPCLLTSVYNKDKKFIRLIRVQPEQIILKLEKGDTIVDHTLKD